ncbi:hypothetical protein [Ralstonia flaminis]|jgi:hypothetical protein|uniref:Integral membrane protein n=1 Tax=Ralstonia flaminis TaxID=3058597 RepID=A0ABM9K8W3_9RALS|nr:hypothetical protein [Ralstonia sp. LMG 18101]CAJ0819257.1 hypothetical protein LMG18101_03887 [Ralstonia sp. LMG 18101]
MQIVLLQIAYLCIALAFNALSASLALAGRKPLAPTNLVAATGVFALYALALWSGHAGFDTAYRAAMLCFVLVLGAGGVLAHLRRGPTQAYRSVVAWMAAILTNGMGVVLNVAGALLGARAVL